MNQLSTHHFSIAGLAAAIAIAASLHGAMLLGFDQLASAQGEAAGSTQLVKADGATKQVELPRVVISARRA
jgi:hypothetical protein